MDLVRFIDRTILFFLNHFSFSIPQIIVVICAEYFVAFFALAIIWLGIKKIKKTIPVFVTIAIAFLTDQIITSFYLRPRPYMAYEEINHFDIIRDNSSFPSQHSILLFATATSFWLIGEKKTAIYLYSIAVIILLARITMGVHYPSDIAGGAVFGIVIAYLIYRFRNKLKIKKFY